MRIKAKILEFLVKFTALVIISVFSVCILILIVYFFNNITFVGIL